MRLSMRLLGISAAALLLVGCGVRDLPKESVTPVQGKVLLNGAPLCMGHIELTPATPGQGRPATAVVDAKGEFTLSTYSDSEPDGAVPGEYKVSVRTYNVTEGGVLPAGVKPTPVPERYAEPNTSGITVQITEDNGELTIELQQ